MIPPLDEESGYLPPGTHVATIDEVIRRFEVPGYGQRLTISTKLRELFRLVEHFALGMYIDGSYVTSKRSPNDADVIVVLRDDFDYQSNDALQLDRMRMKDRRDLHIFYFRFGMDAERLEGQIWVFSHDRDGNPKGIIYVEICQ